MGVARYKFGFGGTEVTVRINVHASLAHIVRHHQNFSDFSANLASALSMLKWLFALAGVVVILLGLGRVLVRVLEGRK